MTSSWPSQPKTTSPQLPTNWGSSHNCSLQDSKTKGLSSDTELWH